MAPAQKKTIRFCFEKSSKIIRFTFEIIRFLLWAIQQDHWIYIGNHEILLSEIQQIIWFTLEIMRFCNEKSSKIISKPSWCPYARCSRPRGLDSTIQTKRDARESQQNHWILQLKSWSFVVRNPAKSLSLHGKTWDFVMRNEKSSKIIEFTWENMRFCYEKSSKTIGFTMENMRFGLRDEFKRFDFSIKFMGFRMGFMWFGHLEQGGVIYLGRTSHLKGYPLWVSQIIDSYKEFNKQKTFSLIQTF